MRKAALGGYRKWLGNILITATSITATFIFLEVLLIPFLPEPIVWFDPQETYVPHPLLAHQLTPNQTTFTHSFPLKTNSYGLRDHEFPMAPEAGTFRILCVGDSFTFGAGVPLEVSYPKQLESILNTNEQGRYHVINAGVPAYDTWQEAAYLREYGWKFEPDLVIVGVYANDIVPKPDIIPQIINEAGFEKKKGVSGLVPYKVIHLLKRSRVLLLLRDRYDKLVNHVSPSPEYRHMLSILQGTADPFVEDGWAEVDKSFAEMLSLGKKHGFSLWLVIFPMSDQLTSDYPRSSYPSKVKELAKKQGIHFIDLMPAFSENLRGFGSLFIEWDGHPNARAYKIAASEIARHYFISDRKPGPTYKRRKPQSH